MSKHPFPTLRTCESEVEAQSLRAALSEYDIDAILVPGRHAYPDGSLAHASWDVCVAPEDLDDARTVLEAHATLTPHIDWDDVDVGNFEDGDRPPDESLQMDQNAESGIERTESPSPVRGRLVLIGVCLFLGMIAMITIILASGPATP